VGWDLVGDSILSCWFMGFLISSRFVLTAGFKLVYYLTDQTALQFDSIYDEHTSFIDSAIPIDSEGLEWSPRDKEPLDP
jgi:hypothetical protein